MTKLIPLVLAVMLLLLKVHYNQAFTSITGRCSQQHYHTFRQMSDKDENSDPRTTFDQAGRSLIEEEDRKRLEDMGEYDSNPDYQQDKIERMRAAIQARTQDLGIEKSKLSAEYIKERERAANAAGSAQAANEDANRFAGLDLTQISSVKSASANPQWNEDMPSMFYDPEDEMTEDDKTEADPVAQMTIVDQALYELKNAKWPTPLGAIREVGVIIVIIIVSTFLIVGWDKILRGAYTSVGFIPTTDDIKNYAQRFDGLGLPTGWTNNMNDQDVATYSDTVGKAVDSVSSAVSGAKSSGASSLLDSVTSKLPDL